MKKLKKQLITILIIAATSMLIALNAQAQENTIKQKTITVTGVSEMEIIPDEIYVQVDLREYDKKNTGKIDIETIKNNFLTACKAIGIADSDVSVQSFDGYDNYWLYKRTKIKNPDMKASISYWVKINSVKKMDELVDSLDDEATQNFFIAKISHTKMDEIKKQMKIAAIKAAKDKATYLSEAINEHVGEAITIYDVNEINDAYVRPMSFGNVAMKENAETAMNVDFKKIKLQFSVNVVFALK